MKKYLFAMLGMAMVALVMAPVYGAPGTGIIGTLYEQEGTAADGTTSINAAGKAPTGHSSITNWKYQYGGGTFTAVYAGPEGWDEDTLIETGDMALEVEADIEMYMTQTISNNKIYFHVGNLYSATTADLTAYVQGTFTSNNGMYIGINFTGQSKTVADFEKVGSAFTGKIIGGMQSNQDSWRVQNNQMDVEIKLFATGYSTDWEAPVNYGDGSHNTIHDTLWWLVNNGAAGSYSYQWRIRLLPTAHQPDGDYYLDPVVVAAPVL